MAASPITPMRSSAAAEEKASAPKTKGKDAPRRKSAGTSPGPIVKGGGSTAHSGARTAIEVPLQRKLFAPTKAAPHDAVGAQDGKQRRLANKGRRSEKDEGLWAYIWELVEGPKDAHGTTPPVAAAPPRSSSVGSSLAIVLPEAVLNRRLYGKQAAPRAEGPCLDLVVVKRRLRGKQPKPETRALLRVARGHYDVLGIRRSATANEVHAAYRCQVLRTHPDKGGNPVDFQRVVAAFAELSDRAKRAAYDRTLDFFGRKDGRNTDFLDEPTVEAQQVHAAAGGEDARSCFAAARAAHVKLLASGPQAWAWWLERMQAMVLHALRNILQGKKVLPGAAEGAGLAAEFGPGPQSITRHKGGYKVEVTWDSLHISTGITKSISQAIDWQIALLRTRGVAQARMRRNATLDPLIQEDLLDLLQMEPSLELTFTITVPAGSSKSKKVSTPGVPDLMMAMDFRSRFLALLKARKPEAFLQRERKKAVSEATQGRQKRKAFEKKMLLALDKELQSRSAVNKRKRGSSVELAIEDRQGRKPATEILPAQASRSTRTKTKRKPAAVAPSLPKSLGPKLLARSSKDKLAAHKNKMSRLVFRAAAVGA